METLSLSGIVPQRIDRIEEGSNIAEGQAVLLSATDLTDFDPAVLSSAGSIGLMVNGGDDFGALPQDLEQFSLINIHFNAFTDGRGFTLARRIRRDAGFKGELRASGPLMPDQTQYLARTGFDSLVLEDTCRKADFQTSLTRFALFYQSAQDGSVPVTKLRHPVSDVRKVS